VPNAHRARSFLPSKEYRFDSIYMIQNSKTIAFRKSDTNRAQLNELLQHPVLKSALDAIREAGVPKSMPDIYAGVHPDTIIAHDYHRKVGINEVLSALVGMTYPLNEAPEESKDEAPFEHSLPKELRLESLPPEIRKHFK